MGQALQHAREEIEMLRRLLQGQRQRVWEQNSDQELQRQAQRTKCKVCLDEEVQISFHPCGHLVACEGGANHLHQCPLCRKNIKIQIGCCWLESGIQGFELLCFTHFTSYLILVSCIGSICFYRQSHFYQLLKRYFFIIYMQSKKKRLKKIYIYHF